MNRKISRLNLFLALLPVICLQGNAYGGNETHPTTPGFIEIRNHYLSLDKKHSKARLLDYGLTDCGKPLELFVISPSGQFDPDRLKEDGHLIIFINNGIHPGEPDGIMACMALAKDILEGKQRLPDKTVLCLIPVYNIDGLHITSGYFRSGQNGPDIVAFRGNAQNLDLNRDFIKCDSENARSFTRMYRHWDPDVFVDTHVTDGADYQHVLTLIDSQKDKLHPAVSMTMQKHLLPALYDGMQKRGFPMCPYVNVWGEDPSGGMNGFLESPRYASGYSALFNAFPFVTETHMLKPFAERILATRGFIEVLIAACEPLHSELLESRRTANQQTARSQQDFPIRWRLDESKVDSIPFKGFVAERVPSRITGHPLIKFNREKPFDATVPYRNDYIAAKTIRKPVAYLVPQAWSRVTERLLLNRIDAFKITKDTMVRLPVLYIRNQETGKTPYEGHFMHTNIKTESDTQSIQLFAGDYYIPCDQAANRYIIETLEPEATDAFLAWGFFDAIFQQKEWFSEYLFEETAFRLLQEKKELKAEFDSLKNADAAFSGDPWKMMAWIYRRSPWYEPSHLRYPVYRIEEAMPSSHLNRVDYAGPHSRLKNGKMP